MAELAPRQIAGRWVQVDLTVEDAAIGVRVGIDVERPGELLGEAVAVALLAGLATLARISGPAAGVPLPCSSTGATCAWAQYAFANPDGLVPTALVVTVDQETERFELDDAIAVPRPES